MANFDEMLLNLIEERVSALFEIERAIFTKRYNLSKKHADMFSTYSISMLYSIWEGFVIQSFKEYVRSLNELSISYKYFCDNIALLHFNKMIPLDKYPPTPKEQLKIFDRLRQFFQTDYHPFTADTIDSIKKGNVDLKVLNTLLDSFSLEKFPPHWGGKYKHPNPNLEEMLKNFRKLRNIVAHGGDISGEETVTQRVFQKYKEMVIDLMYEIRKKMMKGLETQSYKKVNQTAAS